MSKTISLPMGENYLVNAVFLAERSRFIETSPPPNVAALHLAHGSLVTSSILSATCALEATINEWFCYESEIAEKHRSRDRNTISALWDLGIPRTAAFPILEKYEIALVLAGREPWEKGRSPYQDAHLLVQLRNALVHYEPTWEPFAGSHEPAGSKEHKLAKALRGKFPPNPLCAPHAPFWPLRCLGSGCALWAAESALAFLEEFFKRCDPKSVLRVRKKRFNDARKEGRSPTWVEAGT